MNKEIKAVSELIARKRKLEKDIGSCLHQLVEDFKTETGISPNSISIGLINVTEFGSFYSENIINQVKVSLDID